MTVGVNDTLAFKMVDTGDSDATLMDIGHGDGYGAYIGMRDDSNNENVVIRAYANPSGYGTHFNAGTFGIGNVQPGYTFTVDSSQNTWMSVFSHWSSASNASLLKLVWAGASPNSSSQEAVSIQDTGGVLFKIISDEGKSYNEANVWGATSDVKLKQDIVDVRSYWDDWKKLRYRKFRLKKYVALKGDDAKTEFGLIAQEVEPIFPRLVDEIVIDRNEDDEPIEYAKTISYSVLNTMMGKVVQELIAKVETLEEEVRILKSS